MKLLLILFVSLLLLASTSLLPRQSAFAAKPVDLAPIVQEQKALAARLSTPGGTAGLGEEQLARIRQAQATVFKVADGKTSLTDLNPRDQVKLKNALADIGAALGNSPQAEERRDICWREQRTGTHLKVTRCATQEEMQLLREGARDWKSKPSVCSGVCG